VAALALFYVVFLRKSGDSDDQPAVVERAVASIDREALDREAPDFFLQAKIAEINAGPAPTPEPTVPRFSIQDGGILVDGWLGWTDQSNYQASPTGLKVQFEVSNDKDAESILKAKPLLHVLELADPSSITRLGAVHLAKGFAERERGWKAERAQITKKTERDTTWSDINVKAHARHQQALRSHRPGEDMPDEFYVTGKEIHIFQVITEKEEASFGEHTTCTRAWAGQNGYGYSIETSSDDKKSDLAAQILSKLENEEKPIPENQWIAIYGAEACPVQGYKLTTEIRKFQFTPKSEPWAQLQNYPNTCSIFARDETGMPDLRMILLKNTADTRGFLRRWKWVQEKVLEMGLKWSKGRGPFGEAMAMEMTGHLNTPYQSACLHLLAVLENEGKAIECLFRVFTSLGHGPNNEGMSLSFESFCLWNPKHFGPKIENDPAEVMKNAKRNQILAKEAAAKAGADEKALLNGDELEEREKLAQKLKEQEGIRRLLN